MVKNQNKKKIVHIIKRDKFTAGYINFMKYDMDAYEHYFITRKGEEMNLINDENMYYTEKDSEILFDIKIRKLLRKCDQIIVSGLFYYRKVCCLFSPFIMKKTYIQFWGGDFYPFRKDTRELRIKKAMVRNCVKRCKCILVLIEEDYKELAEIFGCNKKYLVAPMPSCTKEAIDYSVYLKENTDFKLRILIGNSATPENEHIEVFKVLEHLRDEDIEIVCPLSYGNEEYKERIIEEGKRIFGDKFVPITNYMSKDEYIGFLAKCSVGIFNNDRQQGMGNIRILTMLGKKIYLRKGTAMWNYFVREGIQFYSTQELENISVNELLTKDKAKMSQNINIYEGFADRNKNNWNMVFANIKENYTLKGVR